MDIFSALQTAVSGLKAQSYALGNISGNIANSQTTGYKRVDTSFVDLVAEQPTLNRQVAGSVGAFSQLTNTLQGNIAATDISTNMALNGDGYFVVQEKSTDATGQTTFSGRDLYTRRGDFSLDKDGYLVNGAGLYLMGTRIDPTTGQTSSTGPVRIQSGGIAAQATTDITYVANLPSQPSGATLLTAPAATYAPPATAAFLGQSISGGSLVAYTAAGAPVDIKLRWAKTLEADTTAVPPTQDTWNLYYASDTDDTASGETWTRVATAGVAKDFVFQPDGQLDTADTGTAAITALTVNGVNLGDVNFNYGTNLTQRSSANGQITTDTLQQNGYGTGSLTGVSVSEDGRIAGTYTNGRTLPLWLANVVQFTGDDFLKGNSRGTYEQTIGSGPPIAGLKTTSIVGGNVEQSNTDIAGEFSKIIVTQQAYSANTRVMSTAQQMMSDLINIIR
jgi:flagellar hook protein FlgE